jgi:hypothetical protein
MRAIWIVAVAVLASLAAAMPAHAAVGDTITCELTGTSIDVGPDYVWGGSGACVYVGARGVVQTTAFFGSAGPAVTGCPYDVATWSGSFSANFADPRIPDITTGRWTMFINGGVGVINVSQANFREGVSTPLGSVAGTGQVVYNPNRIEHLNDEETCFWQDGNEFWFDGTLTLSMPAGWG